MSARPAAALAAALLVLPAHADPGRFSATGLDGWLTQTFRGRAPTHYRLAEIDGTRAVVAECHASASGLLWPERVDPARAPVLRWRWRVEGVFAGIREREKDGDDFPARVYVVRDGGWAVWRTRTLVYVWASREPARADWPSAYTAQAHVVALRSGDAEAGQWREERRDVRADFARYFGRALDRIDAVALMTDCDDARGTARAAYGDLRFEPGAP